MILNSIVSPSIEQLGYVTPHVAVLCMSLHDNPVLFCTPRILPYVWVKVVVPTFTALLAYSAREVLSHLGPLAGATLADMVAHNLVLLICPLSF